jgi:hypothetical protein
MSRSYKKAIIKDRPRNYKKSTSYWKGTRSTINNVVKQLKYDPTLEIPNEKTLINDYDYSDYSFNYEYQQEPTVNSTFLELEENKKISRRK